MRPRVYRLQGRGDYPELAQLVTYPHQTPSMMNSRMEELQRLGVQELRETGRAAVQGISVLGKGYCGVVLLAYWTDRDQGRIPVALKIRRTDAPQQSLQKEATHLAIANRLNIGPKLYAQSQNFMVMRHVAGPTIYQWLQSDVTGELVNAVIQTLLWQCYQLDQAGLDHGNLRCITEHVLMQADQPILIDFSSSSCDRRPANVTTLIQGICWGTVLPSLIEQYRPIPDKEDLIPVLRQYKQMPSFETYQAIVRHFHP